MSFADPTVLPRLRPLAFLLLFSLGLVEVACGGGGGSSAAPPPVVAPPPYVRFAALAGGQEVPANASTASGTATFSVDTTTKVLTGTVTTAGVTGASAHIHEGALGSAGPVVIGLTGGTGGVWTVPAGTVLTDAQYASLQAGTYYVNVHSSAFPAGEIRGQIQYRVSFGTLTGAQETPAVTSTATGYGSIAVNSTTGAVSGSVLTFGITGTGAHIHEAATGIAGPIIIPLTNAGGGLWTVPAGATLTSAQVTSWQSGNLYVNVHTAANPAGEIRAQLNLAAPITQATTLTGSKEVPANASTATGTGAVGINPATLELCGGVTTTGLTGTASHIHDGAVGIAGPVIIGLTDTGGGTYAVPAGTRLSPSQFASWLAGSLYLNVHSAAYPGGEIRGQLSNVQGTGGGGTGGGGY